MKKILFALLFLLNVNEKISAQITSANNALPPIIPPSPNAAALGKYGNTPVSTYTGIPNVSIPLYEVRVGDIILPVTMNYHASGIKVEEEASWVGLGWSLDAGGVVTRSSVGNDDNRADGYLNTPMIPDPSSFSGTVVHEGLHNWLLKDIRCKPSVNGQIVDYTSIINIFSDGGYDEQPDNYYYNFTGASGKFVINKSNHAVLLSQQKIKIEPVANGWIITNSNGLRYEFYDKETTFDYIHPSGTSSSYYLTKIVSPTGNIINFFYENSGIVRSQPSLSEGTFRGFGQFPIDYVRRNYTSYSTLSLSKITWKYGQIIFERDANEREDLTAANKLKKIKIYNSTSITPNPSDLIREFEFVTSYFVSSGGTNYSVTTDEAYSKASKRLRLDKIVERSGSLEKPPYVFSYNPTALPYKTSYARDHWGFYNGAIGNTTLIPPFQGILLAPPGSSGFQYYDLPGANRQPSETHMKAGVLEKIDYPTGGSTSFEYDAHEGVYQGPDPYRKTISTFYTALIAGQANNFQQQETNFIGFNNGIPFSESKVKISFVASCIGIDGSFPYNDMYWQLFEDGVLKETWLGRPFPVGCTGNFSFEEYYTVHLVKGKSYKLKVTIPSAYKNSIIEAKVSLEELTFDPNPVEMFGGLRISKIADYDGVDHTSDNVVVYQYENGLLMSYPRYDRAYEDGYLGPPWDTGASNPKTASILQRTSSSNVPLGSTQGNHIGYGKVTVLNGRSGENGKSVFTYHNYTDLYIPYRQRYPGLPTFPDMRNGYLRSDEEYKMINGQFLKIKESINTYELNNQSTVLAAITEQRFENAPLCGDEFGGNNLYFHYYEIPSAWVQLQQNQERIYDQMDVNKAITTTTQYYYDNPSHYQPTRIVKENSKNEKFTTYTTFPEDYTDNSGFVKDLVDAFIVVPVEKTVIKETIDISNSSKVVSGEIYTYKTGGKGLKDITYALKADLSPISLSNFKLSNKSFGTLELSSTLANTPFSKDTRYEPRLTYEWYDVNGNIKQIERNDDFINSYLWDYSNSYPIAEVKNAVQTDIAYTSFESDGTGNWSVPVSIRNESELRTGKKSYSLPDGNISKAGLLNGKKYTISFWAKNGAVSLNGTALTPASLANKNGWQYYETMLTGSPAISTVTIAGTALIDELRLFPSGAQMTTYTYEPLIGITSITDVNNITTYYEYDALGRLKFIKDFNQNIVKMIEYNYQIK